MISINKKACNFYRLQALIKNFNRLFQAADGFFNIMQYFA